MGGVVGGHPASERTPSYSAHSSAARPPSEATLPTATLNEPEGHMLSYAKLS